MAENSAEDKSEKPSAQKLRKAREQGQVSRSRDWAGAVGLLVSLHLMVQLMPAYMEDFRRLFSSSFAPLFGDGTLQNVWSGQFGATMMLLLKMVAPLLLVPLAVALASLVPGGWVFSLAPLMPKFARLGDVADVQRLFKPKHIIDTLTATLKAAALLTVLYYVARGSVTDYVRLQSLPLSVALEVGTQLMLGGVMALCMVFVLFALIDLPVQALVFMREQRMSKREVKEEHKTSEGRPEVRQRIRQVQMQLARRSVRKAVPTADVVIVNPEHYAVALKYDEKRAEAPFLVAKGVDEMALYIREVAAEHGVEVVPQPPLARAIYNTSQVHQQIPAALYQAVARVLGYVMQIKAFRAGRRPAPPAPPSDLAVPRNLSEMTS